ncbi:MAG: hypothetical protein RMN24_08020 [Anaerolineae bacterium]|nr:hypothetical protein [Caldilineales bacterium]MCX7852118.1 hypothetical protein [Caldilineales bacterium]MDW8269095.1 hypothetical protein [Anaerolineae bacterium]
MIVIMDRALCDASLGFCARCSAAFFQKPLGTDRPCIRQIIDDGDDEVIGFVLLTDGRTLRFTLTDETLEGLRLEGWEFLADFDPALIRRGAAARWRELARLPAASPFSRPRGRGRPTPHPAAGGVR